MATEWSWKNLWVSLKISLVHGPLTIVVLLSDIIWKIDRITTVLFQ